MKEVGRGCRLEDLDRIVGLLVPGHLDVLDWLKGTTSEDPLP